MLFWCKTGYCQIDPEDLAKVRPFEWYLDRNHSGNRYAKAWVNADGKRTSIRMHRFILNVTDPKILVDHRNTDSLDNRKLNLRQCCTSENTANTKRSSRNKSGYKGVYFDSRRKKWTAKVTANRIVYVIGHFACPTKAFIERCKAVKKYHGEYARYN